MPFSTAQPITPHAHLETLLKSLKPPKETVAGIRPSAMTHRTLADCSRVRGAHGLKLPVEASPVKMPCSEHQATASWAQESELASANAAGFLGAGLP